MVQARNLTRSQIIEKRLNPIRDNLGLQGHFWPDPYSFDVIFSFRTGQQVLIGHGIIQDELWDEIASTLKLAADKVNRQPFLKEANIVHANSTSRFVISCAAPHANIVATFTEWLDKLYEEVKNGNAHAPSGKQLDWDDKHELAISIYCRTAEAS